MDLELTPVVPLKSSNHVLKDVLILVNLILPEGEGGGGGIHHDFQHIIFHVFLFVDRV